MKEETLKQLEELLPVLKGEKFFAQTKELVQVFKAVSEAIKKIREENLTTSNSVIAQVQDIVQTLAKEHNNLIENVKKSKDLSKNVSKEVKKELKEALNSIKLDFNLLRSEMALVENGKDADNDYIIQEVLSQIKLPEYKEVVLDDGEEIVNKINDLPTDNDSLKIDASHIKNLPKVINQGVTGSRNLYQMGDTNIVNPTNDQVLKYNSTTNKWENGTGGGSGGGDMTKAVYDPANIGEQLVGLTATQTLTNKTLDSYTNFIHADGIHFRVKAMDDLVRGDVLKFVGFNAGQQAIEVEKRNDTAVPAIGVLDEDILTGDFGMAVSNGLFKNIDTSAFAEGTILYPDGAGSFTDTPNIATGDYNQQLAYVVLSHAVNGEIMINVGAGHDIASQVAFENAISGMTATNVQDAIDEIVSNLSPAGADSEIQFNNSGSFGASSNLTWDDTNNRLYLNKTTNGSYDASQGLHFGTSDDGTGYLKISQYYNVGIIGVRQGGLNLQMRDGLMISGAGVLETASARIHTKAATATDTVMIAQGTTSQTGNLTEWRNTSGTALSVVNASGHLGIGTTTPGGLLTVYSTGGVNKGINLTATSGSSYAPIDFNTDAGLAGQFLATGSTFSNQGILSNQTFLANYLTTGGVHLMASGASGYIEFSTGGLATTNERMRIIATGKVGIGTDMASTNNYGLLNVNGRITAETEFLIDRTAGNTSAYMTGFVREGGATGAFSTGITGQGELSTYGLGAFVLGTSDAKPLIFGTSGVERIRILSDGSVGIGTTSPSAKLHTKATSASDIVGIFQGTTSQSGNLTEWRDVGGTAVARITSNGRGIFHDIEVGVAGINIAAVGGNGLNVSGGGFIIFKSSGVLMLSNSSVNDWDRLQFGGTTSSFPAIKRSSATLQARLADDSDYATFHAKTYSVNGTAGFTGSGAYTNFVIEGGIITSAS